MFGTLLSPLARWAIGILIALAIVFGIYYKGRLDERKLFDAYKAEVAAVAQAQEEKAKQIDAKNKRLFQESQNAYNTRLATLRSYYSMRISSQSGGKLPPVSGTAPGANDFSADQLPPVTTLAAQCAETTLTLYSLQSWIKDATRNME
jgi:hypothetical protein